MDVQNETIEDEIIVGKEEVQEIDLHEAEYPDDHKHLDDFVPNETKEYKEILEGKSHIQQLLFFDSRLKHQNCNHFTIDIFGL